MTIAPLMPKGTAVWLIHNTKLSFKQIAQFCGMHALEIQNLADNEDVSMAPFDPIASGQLTLAEIKRCEENPSEILKISEVTELLKKKSKVKYVPIARRSDRPNAILWMIRNYPKLTDKEIMQLLGSTPKMIQSIRDKTYSKYETLIPQNPASLYLCESTELNIAIDKYLKREQITAE